MLSKHFYGALLESAPCQSTLVEPHLEFNVEMIPSSPSTMQSAIEGQVFEDVVGDCTGGSDAGVERMSSPSPLAPSRHSLSKGEGVDPKLVVVLDLVVEKKTATLSLALVARSPVVEIEMAVEVRTERENLRSHSERGEP